MKAGRGRRALQAIFVVVLLVGATVLAFRAVSVRAFLEVWSRALPDTGHPSPCHRPISPLSGAYRRSSWGPGRLRLRLFAGRRRPSPAGPPGPGGIPVDSTPSVAPLGPLPPMARRPMTPCSSASATRPRPTRAVTRRSTRTAPSAGSWPSRTPPPTARPGTPRPSWPPWRSGDLQGGTPTRWPPRSARKSTPSTPSSGATLPGFPWFTSDSDFSTPALADLYGNGQTDIVEGGDQTAGWPTGSTTPRAATCGPGADGQRRHRPARRGPAPASTTPTRSSSPRPPWARSWPAVPSASSSAPAPTGREPRSTDKPPGLRGPLPARVGGDHLDGATGSEPGVGRHRGTWRP